MSALSKDALLRQIAREEALLDGLRGQQDAVRGRLQVLRDQLACLVEAPPTAVGQTQLLSVVPTTPAEKVALFRRLFRGREDVFPRLWANERTGKSGYAPACSNEWVRGICEKPRVKCGECPNQAFIPVGNRAVLDHLRGRHVIGVYPLRQDDSCCFLAIDFDGPSWVDDVNAFTETCGRVGVPTAVERSRSGNGAHVWFFFAAPVAAAIARQMGCSLITETMARRHQLRMASYDRLFPNQDTLPRGGFGNLIALPLQRGPRERGNTVFLDARLEPYPDQWAYLASVPTMEPAAVDTIAREAVRERRVLGVRFTEASDDDENTQPRILEPRPRGTIASRLLPDSLHAVLEERLLIDKRTLPSSLLNEIKRLAAFENPEFHARQRLRLSTARTPRIIVCSEELPEHVALPRGCLADLEELLGEHGIRLAVDDQRASGAPLAVTFQGRLTQVQEKAAEALLKNDIGVLAAPSGLGKTVVAAYLIARRACSTLILVHRTPLVDQWVSQLSLFLGIDRKQIGRIGGGARKPTGSLDVAMIQSLARKRDRADLVPAYGHVIVDECHHVPAVSFERVVARAKARYMAGLTATPRRRDGHHPIIHMQLGPVRFALDPRSEAVRRPFSHRLVVRETAFRLKDSAVPDIQTLYRALAADEQRNHLILDDVIQALEEGRSPIVLTERRDHLEYFADHLRAFTRHLVVLQGGLGKKARQEVAARLASIPDSEERLVLATGRYVGEGFDDARLDSLFLALPVAWRGTLQQYAGRLHRLHPGKTEVRLYDYVDRHVPMLLKMFQKRLRGYRALGYTEKPHGEETRSEPVIEWDDEGLGSSK